MKFDETKPKGINEIYLKFSFHLLVIVFPTYNAEQTTLKFKIKFYEKNKNIVK